MGVVMISSSLNRFFKKSYDFVICDINKKIPKIMALHSHNHGVGAIVSALLRLIYPSEHICNKFLNVVQGQLLENCLTIRHEVKKVSQMEQLVLVVHNEDFKNPDDSYIELHGVKQYWKLNQQGHTDYFFDTITTTDENANSQEETLMLEAVSEHINGNSHATETIQVLRDEVDVYDNNEPTPENIPQSTDPTSSPLNTEWGHCGFCNRKSLSMQNSGAKLNFHVNPTEDDYYLQLFQGFFPKDLLNMIIAGINTKIISDLVTYGEFVQWIGLWIMVSTVAGTDHQSPWSTCDLDIFQGCFFMLSNYMTQTRFENILNNLTYTNMDPHEYKDRFWQVCNMLDCWNKNMAIMFLPSCMNCIDESMRKCINEFTCPGLMFVPHKPWYFGNEYHDAGCVESDIILSL